MGAATPLARSGVNLLIAQKMQAREISRIKRDQDRQIAVIKSNEKNRRQSLQQGLSERIARERARAGARGVSTTGGSIDAIVESLTQEARRQDRDLGFQSKNNIEKIRKNDKRKKNNLLTLTKSIIRQNKF